MKNTNKILSLLLLTFIIFGVLVTPVSAALSIPSVPVDTMLSQSKSASSSTGGSGLSLPGIISMAGGVNNQVVTNNVGSPSALTFLMILAAAIGRLFVGDMYGFFALAFMGLPLIGVFLLLYIVGKYVSVITIFRKEEFHGYAKIFGWGMAFIGVASNNVFGTVYGLLGTGVSNILFFFLAFFMIYMFISRMNTEKMKGATAGFAAKAGQLQGRREYEKLANEGKDVKKTNKYESRLEKDVQIDSNIDVDILMLSEKGKETLNNMLKIIKDFVVKLRNNTLIKMRTGVFRKKDISHEEYVKELAKQAVGKSNRLQTQLDKYSNYFNKEYQLLNISNRNLREESTLFGEVKANIIKLEKKFKDEKNKTKEQALVKRIVDDCNKEQERMKEFFEKSIKLFNENKGELKLQKKLIRKLFQDIDVFNSDYKVIQPTVNPTEIANKIFKELNLIFTDVSTASKYNEIFIKILKTKVEIDKEIKKELKTVDSKMKKLKNEINSELITEEQKPISDADWKADHNLL